MNKKFIWILALLMTLSTIRVYSANIDKLEPINKNNSQQSGKQSSRVPKSAPVTNNKAEDEDEGSSLILDKDTIYYPNANIKSAVAKYKFGNYAGCLQELFSLTKKDPSNALAYYYMAMAYTHVDMKNEAVEAYEKVISLHPNEYLVEYAIKGRDCLTDGPACKPIVEEKPAEELDDLDKFIRAPYGNGLSPELNKEIKQKQLINIKETINQKEELEHKDIQRIKDFDSNKSTSKDVENEKIAQVSDEDVLNAIKTLKDAGLSISVQSENPYAQMMQYQNPQMAEMSMLLGNNNNNGNNMMNMLPMLMSQAQKGENIDPRVMQAMMMNSMMADFSFNNDNNK